MQIFLHNIRGEIACPYNRNINRHASRDFQRDLKKATMHSMLVESVNCIVL